MKVDNPKDRKWAVDIKKLAVQNAYDRLFSEKTLFVGIES